MPKNVKMFRYVKIIKTHISRRNLKFVARNVREKEGKKRTVKIKPVREYGDITRFEMHLALRENRRIFVGKPRKIFTTDVVKFIARTGRERDGATPRRGADVSRVPMPRLFHVP